jgi:hypothetical protein
MQHSDRLQHSTLHLLSKKGNRKPYPPEFKVSPFRPALVRTHKLLGSPGLNKAKGKHLVLNNTNKISRDQGDTRLGLKLIPDEGWSQHQKGSSSSIQLKVINLQP